MIWGREIELLIFINGFRTEQKNVERNVCWNKNINEENYGKVDCCYGNCWDYYLKKIKKKCCIQTVGEWNELNTRMIARNCRNVLKIKSPPCYKFEQKRRFSKSQRTFFRSNNEIFEPNELPSTNFFFFEKKLLQLTIFIKRTKKSGQKTLPICWNEHLSAKKFECFQNTYPNLSKTKQKKREKKLPNPTKTNLKHPKCAPINSIKPDLMATILWNIFTKFYLTKTNKNCRTVHE